VLPFMAQAAVSPSPQSGPALEWDFVYVADGEAHKNHTRLLQAWRLLAQQGLRPRLALTLGARDQPLLDALQALQRECAVEIHNLGQMPHAQVLQLYQRARALIFPSLTESFGLPLLEARQLGLPILAPELDYVRDVCEPAETFDPHSARSIARAVQRFVKQPEARLEILTAADFWQAFLGA
jgi:glycosyltransferase involved in cell wall biosynthesis